MKPVAVLVALIALACVSGADLRPDRKTGGRESEDVQPKFQYPEVRRDDSVKDDYFGTIVRSCPKLCLNLILLSS